MTDIILPSALKIARSSFRYIGNAGVTRGAYNGILQTTGYGGDRVGATLDFTVHGGASTTGRSERAQLMAFLMRMRSRQNRVLLPDVAHSAPRGSFPAVETFANTNFNGTTSWSAAGNGALSAADGALRVSSTASGSTASAFQSLTLTANVPYVLRSFIADAAQSSGLSAGPHLSLSGTVVVQSHSTTRGYRLASGVVLVGTALSQLAAVLASTTGYFAGAAIDLRYASLSRCLLLDGGGNKLLFSDQIDNAAWSKLDVTVASNVITAPIGGVVADRIVEDTTTADHFIGQTGTRTSQAEDLCAYGFFTQAVLDRDVRLQVDDGAGNGGYAIFDLSAGTFGTVTGLGGGSHTRAFMRPAGNDWYFCAVIAQCPATTSVRALAYMVNAGAINYLGTTGAIGAWRLGAYPSSSPTRGAQTTSAAVDAEDQTGTSIYVKGGATSSGGALAGALVEGDWLECDGHLHMVTSSLDLDAVGCGRLECSPPLYRDTADNTPIILCNPLGRFVLASEVPEWSNDPGVISAASVDFEEAFA
jgi:hypothetical protein